MDRESGRAPRLARVYDGRSESGRPFADRATLAPEIRESLLAYLEAAPIVLAARSFDVDEFAPRERDVPLTFRTDGVGVWSGAVAHYLRKHGFPPDPDLVSHIVGRNFEMDAIDDATKNSAVSVVTGG